MIYRRYIIRNTLFYFSFFFVCLLSISIILDGVTTNFFRTLSIETWKTHLIDQLDPLPMFVVSAMLLAFLTICMKARKHREFALLAIGGLSKKQIFAPFLGAATIVIFGFCSLAQWGLPYLYRWAGSAQYISGPQISSYQARHLPLGDGSSLIYRHYAPDNQQLEDVFWVADSDHIWHFHAIELATHRGLHPHLACRQQGSWSLVPPTLSSLSLPFTVNTNSLVEMIDPKSMPISDVLQYAWAPPANLPSHLLLHVRAYLYRFLLPIPFCLLCISILAPLWLEFYPTPISFRKMFVTLGLFLGLFILHNVSFHILGSSHVSMVSVLILTYCSIYVWGIFCYATLK